MPHSDPCSPLRRRLVLTTAAASLAAITPLFAQPDKGQAQQKLSVGQLVDASTAQQDVSKDFLNGSRAAWQEINARGGIRGRQIQHIAIESDGTPAGIRSALETLRANPSCIALFGTAGDQAATLAVDWLRTNKHELAHAAPWLQNSSLEVGPQTFPIFAARQEQIAHALKTLSVMGMSEIGAVYPSEREFQAFQADVERISTGLQLKLQTFKASGDIRQFGQRLGPKTPAVLLFVGGTPELAEFTQGMEKQSRQRYIVALADVNLQTMLQMGAARSTPVIATQTVPMLNSALPVVRAYRESLAKLFDEPPTSISLAGFIAARYTAQVLAGVEGGLSRHNVLQAFQKRVNLDVGGFAVNFQGLQRSSGYVTQSMLGMDGRLIG